MEGILAFMLESTFLGLWIFGWNRLSPKLHLATLWIAVAGTWLSAFFILVANFRMQHPVGYKVHGATFLTLRTVGDLLERAGRAARRLSLLSAAVGVVFRAWTVAAAVDGNDKDVFPPVVPAAVGIAALALAALRLPGQEPSAFSMTALGALCTVATLFTSLYPRVIVSSTDFPRSLTVDNASSADYTLKVMTVVAVIFLPVVLLYQGWTYHVFRHRVGGGELPAEETPPAAPGAATSG